MFEVVFYKTSRGYSELIEQLEKLRIEAQKNKSERIQYNRIIYCIDMLKTFGTRSPFEITKYLENGIWELRPGDNRILYFYYENNTFVLLHMFKKKTQKNTEIRNYKGN